MKHAVCIKETTLNQIEMMHEDCCPMSRKETTLNQVDMMHQTCCPKSRRTKMEKAATFYPMDRQLLHLPSQKKLSKQGGSFS